MSKHFKPHEIQGYIKIGDKTITVLKMGVRRRYYPDYLDYNFISQMNHEMIFLERYEELMKKLYGGDDFKTEYS